MSENRKILVIEDDAAIRRGVVDALKYEGYAVHEEGTAAGGRSSALKIDCDLVLLDLVLPGGDGLDILKETRRARPTLPVIILTARGDESDRVEGLRLGADDYVVKPFSARELLARVEAVLRRSAARPLDCRAIKMPGVRIDLERREARVARGERIELSEREVMLLRYLAANPDRAVSRDELYEHVWRISPTGAAASRTVDMTIARLREKLLDDSENPRCILTVRGKGYMIAREPDSGST